MTDKHISAFEAKVDKMCDEFPFEGRHPAKKYLYLLEVGIENMKEETFGIRFSKGESSGFIDWFGNVYWGV